MKNGEKNMESIKSSEVTYLFWIFQIWLLMREIVGPVRAPAPIPRHTALAQLWPLQRWGGCLSSPTSVWPSPWTRTIMSGPSVQQDVASVRSTSSEIQVIAVYNAPTDNTFPDSPCDQLEHSVTIIPKLESEFRRKSVVNYAFPELHPEVCWF